MTRTQLGWKLDEESGVTGAALVPYSSQPWFNYRSVVTKSEVDAQLGSNSSSNYAYGILRAQLQFWL